MLDILINRLTVYSGAGIKVIPLIVLQLPEVRLYEYEKEYLLNASKLTGINSLNGVIKYLILNSIYKKGFLSPNELKIIDELKSEIHKIGINLHQILKKLNFKEEFKNDDLKIL